MSKFIEGSWGWIKRSFSESENIQQPQSGSLSAPVTQQSSLDVPEPDLEIEGDSNIMSVAEMERLNNLLPPRLIGSKWKLLFSTEKDGFSLNNIYRKMESRTESPPHTLLVIKDNSGNSFGALVSDYLTLQRSQSFYGNGETFLFRLRPDFQNWNWTGKNSYVINCSQSHIRIGAGEGHFGLSVDSDLNRGRTQSVATYDNEPLCDKEDFAVNTLEVWVFE